MLPIVAIVGRANVGKSSLFNRLIGRKQAIVLDLPGTTLDRHYGHAVVSEREYIVIDTGGLGGAEDPMATKLEAHTVQAIIEADVVLFVVDAQVGLSALDRDIAKDLRKYAKPIILVLNKTDGVDITSAIAEYYALGFATIMPIAALTNRGITSLAAKFCELFPSQENVATPTELTSGIRISIVGQPNVGKSTLVNRLLGEERVVVFDAPGTTRDSIYVPFTRQGIDYTLIDTAGVRKKNKVDVGLERASVVSALRTIASSDVVILLIDASRGIRPQDLHLAGFIVDSGKCLVVAFNKWDKLSFDAKKNITQTIEWKLKFLQFAEFFKISASKGQGVSKLWPAITRAYKASSTTHPTAKLTKILTELITSHQPPVVSGRRIKLRYAHMGGICPPRIVVHGKQTEKLPNSYLRYLSKGFAAALKLIGTPVKVLLRTDENPYVVSD